MNSLLRLAVPLLAAVLCGCHPEPRITVKNHSPHTLSNLVVSGAGFSERLPVLEPGAEHRWSVRPSGDSGLTLRFDADRRTVDSGKQGYFEPASHYRVEATVQSDLTVSVKAEPKWF
jgi:hypothetical protein